ncbi:AAA family ATPase [Halobium salinum]|uniref:AAA family ATPase n=1 Tax=Halobium salinum TaxID=1364940 RepID=A0ABD5PFC3_9EURY|nr:AAA family ATPase [Halobium salinum]
MSGATRVVTESTPTKTDEPDADQSRPAEQTTTQTATATALVGTVGGAGTTRTAVELAATLARDGHEVAVVDAAFATQGLADYVSGRIDPDATTLVTDRAEAPLSAGLVDLDLDLGETVAGRVACLPARAPFERLARAKTESAARALGDRIEAASERFDHVLVDTPPVASNQALAAVTTADRVVAVTPATGRGADGRERTRDRLADLGVDLDATVAVQGVDGAPEADPADADAVVPESTAAANGAPRAVDDDAFAGTMAEVAAAALGVEVGLDVAEGSLVDDVGERVGAVLNR